VLSTFSRNTTTNNNGTSLLWGGGLAAAATVAAITLSGAMMTETEENDFYEYRYITTQDPDDLAGFYGSEQFMELFCVMPFMSTLMMRGGYFDDEGTVHTTGFPGEMLVNMVFSDRTNAETGKIQWFNKRERFRSVFRGYTAWDMVCNFGFEDLGDGRCMVYHHGAYFKSSLPPVSWFVRGVFGLHARWVAWAAEHHINQYAFPKVEEDEKAEEASRVDMPFFLLKNYAWIDLMSTLLGFQKKEAVLTPSSSSSLYRIIRGEETQQQQQQQQALPPPVMMMASSCVVESKELPVHQSQVLEHIAKDIETDRENSKMILVTEKEEPSSSKNNSSSSTIIIENNQNVSIQKKDSKRIDLHVALQRSNTIMREAVVVVNNNNNTTEDITTGPKAYQAATAVAQHRLSQRRHDHFAHQRKEELQQFRHSLSLLYLGLEQQDVY